ncbi:MAG: hypothetical protein QF926_11630 [Alphaproteobacteria bacterium]|jgi:hypothetical protein|nr:hypothetical protein [Alphaproteobacteria bacterium]MDP6517256.1 hypothetical protein [Alphaproteobacteria bacterium]
MTGAEAGRGEEFHDDLRRAPEAGQGALGAPVPDCRRRWSGN